MRLSTLTLLNIHKTFGGHQRPVHVLRGVDAIFKAGQTCAITGVSGTGKSTLLHILGLIDEPTSGRLLLDGQDVHSLTPGEQQRLLQQDIGHLFQQPYLLDELTVRENMLLKGQIADLPPGQLAARADELLERAGLTDKAHAHPRSLSGGQQQRVALLRAMMTHPSFLIADEPTGNLDEQTALRMVELLMEFVRRYGTGLVVSTHDARVAARMDRVVRLHEGRLEEVAGC